MTPEDRPLLSIVVPFYRVEDYIEECLGSLRDQTLADLEVVMVDDGSPDASRAVAERFAADDPRFRLVTQQNRGLGPARNTGTAHARGRYLAFVDSDDVVPPEAYERLVGSLERTGSVIAAGNVQRFGTDRGVEQSWAHRQAFAATVLGTDLAARPDLAGDRMVWNKVYRRDFWDAGGYAFPAIRYEDYPVTLRAYLDAGSVDVLADHVYCWRDRESGGSITQRLHDIDNARDRYRSATLVLDLVERTGVPAAVRRTVHGHFAHVDLVTLAEAAVHVAPEHREEARRMAADLAARLDPGSDDSASALTALVHLGLRRGDTALVEALARWRTGGGGRRLLADLTRIRPGSVPLLVRVLFGRVLAGRVRSGRVLPGRLRRRGSTAASR